MDDTSDEIDSVVCAAVELASAEERAEYIRQQSAGNAELQQRIESLVEACLRAGNFLEEPAVAPLVETLLSESPGTIIGPYKLLQQIGEGGMGVVFMAEQSEPIHRYVAVKIIKAGMDTRRVIARFEAERQALAMMDHPNIAKVLDAGATESGRPYFVMELVKGVPITRYCDEHRLTPRRRLQLFVQVCQAVQHAHQKGIIHRDLKPSNVPVADYDDQPVPKIIDFGVAKAISQPLTEKTLFTEYGQIIGTFEYMSPEQAKFNQLDIDTRTDVYSLGVLLYELLTGDTPLGSERVRSAGFGEIVRLIGEEEPPTPSTRLKSSQNLPAISAQRQTEPAKLAKIVRGDLDWIVMRCLEKDRNRRYQSASDISTDVLRYLSDQPIEARGPSRFYRLQKFVRRNRVGVLAAAAVAIAVTIGFAAAIVGFARARSEALRSRQAARFLEDMLAGAGPRVARGRDATLLREILDDTSERIKTELQAHPEIEGDLAAILGRTYADIGHVHRAQAMFQQAVDCYRREPGGDNAKLAMALGDLGIRQSFQQNVSAGRKNATLGVEMARRCGDQEALADCLSSLAYACNPWGLTSREGIPYLREALALWRELGTNPRSTAGCMTRLGQTLQDAEGDQLLHEALEIYRTELGDEATQTVNCLWAIAQLELLRGELPQAEKSLRHTYDKYKKLYGGRHVFTNVIWRQLATALVAQGNWEAAEELARPGSDEKINPNHWDLLGKISAYRGNWAQSVDRLTQARTVGDYFDVNRLAIALFAAGRQEEYRNLCSEVISSKHPSTAVSVDGGVAFLMLPADETTLPLATQFAAATISPSEGSVLFARKRINKSMALFRLGEFQRALQTTEPIEVEGGPLAHRAEFLAIRALSYAELRRPDEARAAIESAQRLFVREDRQWEGDPLQDVFTWKIAELLVKEAEELLRNQAAVAKNPPDVSAPTGSNSQRVDAPDSDTGQLRN